ncbi:hypothetical protein Mpop_3716 [Methylorubrum populi BJ001]|jgi:hypothetical protein|uniref:Uncharacterized protein n=2 Tax=Methylorubrum TaxID=2282523 RepID=B1Z8H8_METPB|nr:MULTISPECIES: hypothetical protein [Methylorubrum]ACB81860.1 hypothetical protein Mpop_3716 [Methylorubrum populi BJ001]MBA8914185.1 hypothetical protein [Methylorubrum thiocyanatum]MBB5765806.1 hypothetical protein [Methylorubrum rhodesianum]GJE82454.1 hypothetical protein CJNNKLLH_3819 [Methylorubrum thiocyanatum]
MDLEAQGAVSRVEKVGPTHARGLHHLAGVGVNIRQGEPCNAMRVDFELSCGTAALRIAGRDYAISMRACHVALERENCEVATHSRYEHRLGKGSFEISGTETLSSGRERDAGIGIEASVDANPVKPSLIGLIAGRYKRSDKRNEEKKDVVRREPVVDLIVTSGQDRWQVGDPARGDARRDDGRLQGTYFGEERGKDGEVRELCVVGRVDASQPVVLTATVSASFGHVLVRGPDGPVAEADRTSAEATLRQRSSKAAREHVSAKADLRARVAGLVMAKALGEAQRDAGFPVADGEFLIAVQSLAVPPERVRPEGDDT